MCLPSYILRIIKIKIDVKSLVIVSVAAQELNEDLKSLSGVSKSQVGELVVVMDQKKEVVRGLRIVTWLW